MSHEYIGIAGADGLPISATKVVLINPNTGLPFGMNNNGELISQLKDSIPVTATGAAAAAVTCTLPAGGAGKFTYLAYFSILMYAAAAQTGGATPILVTTTNLPNNPVFTFPTALAIGQVWEEKSEGMAVLKGNAANTAITIVGPATTGVIWRINAAYFIA